MSSREAYFSVGGFTPEFPLNYNDVDYCLKLRERGYRIVYTPFAELHHHESVSKTGTYNSELVKFKNVWLARFPRDPMFSPNLNPAYTDWRILP
jgi:GT2 family glycosyltransferase